MPEQDRQDLSVIGKPLVKVDAAAKVTGENVGSDVELALQLAGSCFEGISFSGDQHNVERVPGENFRQLQSDPAGAAGDERGLTRRSVHV